MLKVSFINVGYGDSILLEYSKSRGRPFRILVDGGSPNEGDHKREYLASPHRRTALGYLESRGVDSLDLLFLTHFHIDHTGGIPELVDKIAIGEMLVNYLPPDDLPHGDFTLGPSFRPQSRTMYRSLELLGGALRTLRKRKVPIGVVTEDRFGVNVAGDLKLDYFSILDHVRAATERHFSSILDHPAAEGEAGLAALDASQNAACSALRLSCHGRAVLLPADLPHPYWDHRIDLGQSIKADLLKFPHHGHADGVSEKMAKAIQPSDLVFTVPEGNEFACPKESAFDFFTAGERFHATGGDKISSRLARWPESPAVEFHIHEDSAMERIR